MPLSQTARDKHHGLRYHPSSEKSALNVKKIWLPCNGGKTGGAYYKFRPAAQRWVQRRRIRAFTCRPLSGIRKTLTVSYHSFWLLINILQQGAANVNEIFFKDWEKVRFWSRCTEYTKLFFDITRIVVNIYNNSYFI